MEPQKNGIEKLDYNREKKKRPSSSGKKENPSENSILNRLPIFHTPGKTR
jgi:hypothetical protein